VYEMYEWIRGPLVWIAFVVFVGGALLRLITMGLLAKQEKIVFPMYDLKYGARSVLRWIVPFAATNMRKHPAMTAVSFAFHGCLLTTPLLVMGHAVLWEESWGVRWWSLPPWLADLMTLTVIAGGLFFFLRRIAAPEVRNVSYASDFLLLLLVVSPFVTGFIAHQQWLAGEAMLALHIVSGALWLMLIPFTRLSHALWFVFTRAWMGSDFGKIRNAKDW